MSEAGPPGGTILGGADDQLGDGETPAGSGAVPPGLQAVGPDGHRARQRWPLVTVAVLAALALTLALVALNERSHLRAQQSRDHVLRQVSGQLVAALTTYDYQHLDAFQKTVLTNATGAFRRDFDARFPALRDVLVADHSRATGTVQDIFVGPVESGRATTLVRVIYTVTGLTGTRQIGSYDSLTVLRVNGRWQVDDIQTLLFNPSQNAGAAPPATGSAGTAPSTTATSAPRSGP
jgi:hypothetical protein